MSDVVMMGGRTMPMHIHRAIDRGMHVQAGGLCIQQRDRTDQRERQDLPDNPHHVTATMLYRTHAPA